MDTEKVTDMLNELIQVCRDGADGFKTCENVARDPLLKAYFRDLAQSCEDAAQTLSAEIIKYGGHPSTSGNPAAVLHRAWIDIKTALTDSRDNITVLEECERGEAAALVAYENALRLEMPDSLREILNQQHKGVKKNHNDVCQMRDGARNKDLV